ncbi:alpha/beta fold hydrolase [Isobaculum melis]|uniref:Pimeloyl-ACP methyl ester carboxylesterase n=1 Tax=Isobaculum melis TaxID=142588 RepID=A0A1H9RL53_9LACT|nr:alpha/beta hydrolase [Isobaculum melis]SER73502.1 Pimeloyl-ACP methyl ester carboxylesterase [Isobaculum melis]
MYQTVKDCQIYYEIFGTGTPLVFLHGYAVDHHIMSEAFEPILSNHQEYQRIYIDLPGMGNSIASPNLKNADDLAEVLIEFLNSLLKNQSFILFGNSYGGYLSLELTFKLKERVKGLFLLCPVVIASSQNRTVPLQVEVVAEEPISVSENTAYFDDFQGMMMLQNQQTWQCYQESVVTGLQLRNKQFIQQFQQNGYQLSTEEKMRTERSSVPTMLLLGKQDQQVGYQDQLFLVERFKNLSCYIDNFAGHNFQIDNEPLFQMLVLRFMEKLK